MKFKNYSKFAKTEDKTNIQHEEMIAKNEETVQAVHDEIIEEIVNTGLVHIGVVNCKRLNVREKASINSKILCVINENEEVKIRNIEIEYGEFYRIATLSGVEGFCMKKFITVK